MTESSRVEELVMTVSQPPNSAIVEQAGGRRVRLLVVELGDHRAVALLGEDLLRRLRHGVVDERLRLLGVLRLLGHRDRVLDQDRLVGDDVLDRPRPSAAR